MGRFFVVVTLAAALAVPLAGLTGCEVATPLAPAEPIGEFPVWGEDFNTPKEQPASNLGMPGLPGQDGGGDPSTTSSTGAAMPGALKSFEGGDVTLGKGVYVSLCARCHGAAGEGGALPGGVVVTALADAAVQARLDDKAMARSIALGKGAMPSFRAELNRDQLAGVIAYVRTLKK